jgi:hypothetical protein
MLNSIILLFYEEFIQMIIVDKSNLVVFMVMTAATSEQLEA